MDASLDGKSRLRSKSILANEILELVVRSPNNIKNNNGFIYPLFCYKLITLSIIIKLK